jgi:hypothetical protein
MTLQPPPALVHRPVVGPAQQGQIGQVGRAAMQPVAQMMGLAPGRRSRAAGKTHSRRRGPPGRRAGRPTRPGWCGPPPAAGPAPRLGPRGASPSPPAAGPPSPHPRRGRGGRDPRRGRWVATVVVAVVGGVAAVVVAVAVAVSAVPAVAVVAAPAPATEPMVVVAVVVALVVVAVAGGLAGDQDAGEGAVAGQAAAGLGVQGAGVVAFAAGVAGRPRRVSTSTVTVSWGRTPPVWGSWPLSRLRRASSARASARRWPALRSSVAPLGRARGSSAACRIRPASGSNSPSTATMPSRVATSHRPRCWCRR